MHDTRAKNAYMKAERASAELRRGGHVMLRLNNGEAALFRGAEFADGEDINFLSRLAGSGPLLVLTANRVKSLQRSLRQGWPAATIALAEQGPHHHQCLDVHVLRPCGWSAFHRPRGNAQNTQGKGICVWQPRCTCCWHCSLPD